MLPDGVRDVWPEEAERRAAAEGRLLRAFAAYGYRLVQPPLLEFLSVAGAGLREEEELYKLTDHRGRLLALRADFTPSVARMVGARPDLADIPVRVAYGGEVFRFRTGGGEPRQWRQVGVEAFGLPAPLGEVEMVQLVAACAQVLGLQPLSVSLGHVGLVAAVLQWAGMPEDGMRHLAQGDLVGFQRRLVNLAPGPRRVLEGWLAGQGLEAVAHVEDPGVVQAREEVQAVLRLCRDHVSGVRVEFHPLLVRDLTYYTGAVWEVEVPGWPRAVGVGGRYDRLAERFGTPRPALGMALELEALAALGTWTEVREERAVVTGGEEGLARAEELRRRGVCVEVFPADVPRERVEAYARGRGARLEVP